MAATTLCDKLALVGVGIAMGHNLPPEQPFTARSLAAEAARLAIADAGLEPKDVDGAINALDMPGPGLRLIEVDAFPRVLGLPINFYFYIGRGGAPGTFAISAAFAYLEHGLAKYVVIAGGANDRKRSRRPLPKIGIWNPPFGGSHASAIHSFFASRHMHEYGTTSRQLGMVTVQERQWAAMNPHAKMYKRPITIEDHQNSPLFVEPYRLLDMCLTTDGGIAFVITTAERARDLRHRPVYVKGLGFGDQAGQLWWEKHNYTTLAVASAKEQAFRAAGIELEDLDLAQFYDCFTMEVIMQLEDYGWCGKGEGGPFVEVGNIGPGGTIPINTYGGLIGAYHLDDLGGIAEGIVQLRGEAGVRQVEGAELCLVTGHGGEMVEPMCSIHTSLVLGNA